MRFNLLKSLVVAGLLANVVGTEAFALNRFAVVCGKDDSDLNNKGINLGCALGSIAKGQIAAGDQNNQCQWFDISTVSTPTVQAGLICVTVSATKP